MKKDGIDLEDEDLSHENHAFAPASGKHKFDMMLKSMLARLEFTNSLAPIEDYGRHQTRMTHKKKKKKPAQAANPNPGNQSVEPSEG
jgi:hypothetical protein